MYKYTNFILKPKSKLITIINTKTGNFLSVVNMLKKIGYKSILTDDINIITNSKIIIFPGVGNFDTVMSNVYEKKIDKAICAAIAKGSKILGICVGMQALFNESSEGTLKGLGIINGKIKKFVNNDINFKVPHMGWNNVRFINHSKFNINLNKNRFYFVHSYFAECENKEDVLGETHYLINFVSAVKKKMFMVSNFILKKVIFMVKNF